VFTLLRASGGAPRTDPGFVQHAGPGVVWTTGRLMTSCLSHKDDKQAIGECVVLSQHGTRGQQVMQ